MSARNRAMEQREGSIGNEAFNIRRFSLSYKMQTKTDLRTKQDKEIKKQKNSNLQKQNLPNGVKISTCMAAFVMRRFRVEACRKLGVVGVGLGKDGRIGYKDCSRPWPTKKSRLEDIEAAG